MRLRTLFALSAVCAAFAAGRATSTRVEAQPATDPSPVRTARAPIVRCPPAPVADEVTELDDDDDEDPDAVAVEDTATLRQLACIAELEAGRGPHGALRGQIRAQTGEPLLGVTVEAVRRVAHTAISDEHGWFEIAGLSPDTYAVTVYYADATVEHLGVAVTARQITPFQATFPTAEDSGIPGGEPELLYADTVTEAAGGEGE